MVDTLLIARLKAKCPEIRWHVEYISTETGPYYEIQGCWKGFSYTSFLKPSQISPKFPPDSLLKEFRDGIGINDKAEINAKTAALLGHHESLGHLSSLDVNLLIRQINLAEKTVGKAYIKAFLTMHERNDTSG